MFAPFDIRSTTPRPAHVAIFSFGLVVITVLVIGLVFAISRDDQTPNPAFQQSDPSQDLALPLGLADLEFSQATIEATPGAEGPGAAGFCNLSADISGLVKWKGNRVTESGQNRRVAQMVLVFGTPFDASSYVSSTADNVSCDHWVVESNGNSVSFEVTPSPYLGRISDETVGIDVTANTGESKLFTRTALVRSANWVFQVTVVSANPDDIEATADLAAKATSKLDF